MNLFDIFRMGLKNLWRRKVRTFLTVLGVVIGTAAIVVMLSLGIGMDESFKQQVSRMGSLNIINVNTYYFDESGGMQGQPKKTTLDDMAILNMAAIDGVEAVTPLLQTSMMLVSGKYTSYANLVGIDIDTMEAFDFKVSSGRLLSKDDNNGMVFGCTVPQQFFNPKAIGRYGYVMGGQGKPPVDVLNDKLQATFDMSYGMKRAPGLGGMTPEENNKPPKLYKMQGIGLLAESQSEKDYSVYMDIDQLKKMIDENNRDQRRQGNNINNTEQQGYNQAMVKVKDINRVDAVQQKIKAMGFGTSSLVDLRKSMQKTARSTQTMLGAIGAISLLIAALGIANTMVMSIYERTREIGIMKVLGCLFGDIRRIFLFEAGVIGFLGGMLGIGLSFVASLLINHFGGNFMNMGIYIEPGQQAKISVIPLWLDGASVAFATLVGLISGFYPARRAMRLSALEAIKTE